MRKILISVLIVLLLVLAYFTVFQGISIGSFRVLSADGISNLNDTLTAKIDEINKKIKVVLQAKETELSRALDGSQTSSDSVGLLQAKESYYNLVNVSTENEISMAQTQETYTREYLMLRLGRHAREEGVNITVQVVSAGTSDSSMTNINFTVVGQYGAIINFISSLEDDSELAFRIDNFNMVQSGELLQATFDVAGVRIKVENTTETVSGSTNSTTDTQSNDTSTNATDTTNTTSTDNNTNTVDTTTNTVSE